MIILLTGGAACGKSALAERLCLSIGTKIVYVATMQPFGTDAAYRIARHLALREGKGFGTAEQYTGIGVLARQELNADTLLVECMSNLLANEMFSPEGAGDDAVHQIVDGIVQLSSVYQNLVIVTNEVGGDGIEYPPETAAYIENMGSLNRQLVHLSDVAIEVCCGIPVYLKGTLSEEVGLE